MCTIIVRHGIDDRYGTIVASNRDEFYERKATSPMVLLRDPLVVGGKDEREGGTWFGLTASGLFVGLTNQRNFGPRDGTLRSRGGLVVDALAKGSLEGVYSFLREVDSRQYNEFNLVFGDGAKVATAYGRRNSPRVEIEQLGSGVFVLCNDRMGSSEFPKAIGARDRVRSISVRDWPGLKQELVEVLSDRSLPDPDDVPPLPPGAPFDEEVARRLQAICVETPIYGTVSSTIAAVSPGGVDQYWFSDGPPNEGSFRNVLHLMRGHE